MRTEIKYSLYADYFRASGTCGRWKMLKSLLRRHHPGFSYLVALRICQNLSLKKGRLFRILLRLAECNLRRVQLKYGTEIPWQTEPGAGLLLPHPGGIVIHPGVRIGKNCTVLQGVTIGNNLYQDRNAVAVIGENVIISAGVVIVGPVTIGDNVTIGANAVVTRDIPSGCVVAGVPAQIIATKASVLINCDYVSLSSFIQKTSKTKEGVK